jgi:hypothetical protein
VLSGTKAQRLADQVDDAGLHPGVRGRRPRAPLGPFQAIGAADQDVPDAALVTSSFSTASQNFAPSSGSGGHCEEARLHPRDLNSSTGDDMLRSA